MDFSFNYSINHCKVIVVTLELHKQLPLQNEKCVESIQYRLIEGSFKVTPSNFDVKLIIMHRHKYMRKCAQERTDPIQTQWRFLSDKQNLNQHSSENTRRASVVLHLGRFFFLLLLLFIFRVSHFIPLECIVIFCTQTQNNKNKIQRVEGKMCSDHLKTNLVIQTEYI